MVVVINDSSRAGHLETIIVPGPLLFILMVVNKSIRPPFYGSHNIYNFQVSGETLEIGILHTACGDGVIRRVAN